MSLISRLLKANPSAQVSDMLTGYFVIPSAKGEFFEASTKAFFGAGSYSGNIQSNIIESFEIASTGNAVDFGDLASVTTRAGACGSTTKGLWGGGGYHQGPQNAAIQQIVFKTQGNATSVGNLTSGRWGVGGTSNTSRGLWFGGFNGNSSNIIDYVTLSSIGNAVDFGDLTVSGHETSATLASPTRAVCGNRDSFGSGNNTMDYVTIATTGNATDFGDMGLSSSSTGFSSNTRGVFAGNMPNTIEYITIASTGNATDFGNTLDNSGNLMGSTSNSIRGVIAGNDSNTNVIQYVTIASTGNATDFGDLTVGRNSLTACSASDGGLT
jgi:hypothetical protein